MYKLTILLPDLTIFNYSNNPFTDTLPVLVSMLADILDITQSYSTIHASIAAQGSYARAALDQFGNACIVVIAPAAE